MTDAAEIRRLGLEETRRLYARVAEAGDPALIRWMCLNDRFFLLTCALGLTHMNNAWCYARCREVEESPDGWLDLWSRGHYKSTIITLGGIVQEVLRDPEITCCVLSYNSPTAQKFVGQIKQALENAALRELFHVVFWLAQHYARRVGDRPCGASRSPGKKHPHRFPGWYVQGDG